MPGNVACQFYAINNQLVKSLKAVQGSSCFIKTLADKDDMYKCIRLSENMSKSKEICYLCRAEHETKYADWSLMLQGLQSKMRQ